MKRVFLLILGAFFLVGLCACGAGESVPTWQEQYDLGIRYLSEGNYEEAIIAFTVAIEIDPKQAPAYVGRGNAHILSGETEENLAAAQADYEQAIELNKTNADAYLGLADVYIRQKAYDKALEILLSGLTETGQNQEISDKISEIESGNISDSAGNPRRISYYKGGTLRFYQDYTYNNEGRQAVAITYDPNGNQTDRFDFVYGENGEELVTCEVGGDGAFYRIEQTFDVEGRVIKRISYNKDGTKSRVETMEYNSVGQLSRTDVAEEGYYILYEYDSSGNNTKESYYLTGGTPSSSRLHEYDDKGIHRKTSFYNNGGELMEYELYIYDENSRYIASELYNADGSLYREIWME